MSKRPHRRVLILEDESVVAMLVEDLLADLGFTDVRSTATVAAALEAIDRVDYAFALLDVKLGEHETSFEAARRLRLRGIPFAFVTGYGARGLPPEFAADAVLDKPIDPEGLHRVIRRMTPPAA